MAHALVLGIANIAAAFLDGFYHRAGAIWRDHTIGAAVKGPNGYRGQCPQARGQAAVGVAAANLQESLNVFRIAAAADLPIVDLLSAPTSPPGPSAADVAAASEMSGADRAEFIRSMVSRLAERLEDEPVDLDGWMRLANAYAVLQEEDRAIEAYRKVEALLEQQPANDPRRAAVRDALERLGG